jgi:hypothetical protein
LAIENGLNTVGPLACTVLHFFGPQPITASPNPNVGFCNLSVAGGFPVNTQMVAQPDGDPVGVRVATPDITPGNIAIGTFVVASNTTYVIRFQIAVPPA